MKIAAPIDSLDEVDPVIDAGADELFVGVQDDTSMRLHPDSPNRRYGHASLRSFAALRAVVDRAHARHVDVRLAINNLCYDAEGWRAVEHQLREGVAAGVDAFILPEPGAIALGREIAPGRPLHASTVGLCHNVHAVALYRDLGVARIVCDRHLRLGEIRELSASAPGIEFEAFLLNDGCYNVDGHCWCVHAPRFPRVALPFSAGVKGLTRRLPMPFLARLYRGMYPCVIDGQALTVLGDGQDGRRVQEALRARFTQEGLQFRCGLCAIPALLAAGIHAIKVVGRGYPTHKKVDDVRAARKSLTLAEWGLTGPEFHRHAERQFELARGFPCRRRHCYYEADLPEPVPAAPGGPPRREGPPPAEASSRPPAPSKRPPRGSVEEEGLSIEAYLEICRGRKGRMSRGMGRRLALEFAPGLAGMTRPAGVVEIGCGPGLLVGELAKGLARRIAARVPAGTPAVQAWGIDVDPAMIEAARREQAASGVTFLVSEPDRIPLPSGCADVIVSEDSLHHWSNAPAMLREILRIASPEARILILDLNPDGRLARLNSTLHSLLRIVGIREASGRGFVSSMGRAFSVAELESLVARVAGPGCGLRVEGGAFSTSITKQGRHP